MDINAMVHTGHSVGDADGFILAVDASICDLLHRPARALIGLSYLQITHPDDRATNARQLATLPEGEAAITIRKRYLRADGTAVPVDLIVSRLTMDERGGRLVGTLRWSTSEAATPRRLWEAARRIETQGQLRAQLLGGDLFPDYPMRILLHTYIAELEGRAITAAGLAEDLGLAVTLTERWLAALRAHGLIDPFASADAPHQLSAKGIARLERLLAASA